MFEDKTFENIMADMTEENPDGLDTQEGSLIWNACSKMAVRLEDVYGEMDYLLEQLLVDTQDLDFLIRSGAECGVLIKEATPAVFLATLNITAEVGDRFTHTEQEFNYVITEILEENSYKMECEDAGAEPNDYLGEIEPLEYMDDFENGKLTELLIPGTDEEDEEAYRERRLEFQGNIKPFGGNRTYYKSEIKNIGEVGGVKISRRLDGEETIPAVIISSAFRKPSEAVLLQVQNSVDPVPGGSGDGIAPIGHKVQIMGVTEITINLSMAIIFEDGFTVNDVKSKIVSAIDDYFNELATNWESTTQIAVRSSQVISRVAAIEGIIDVSSVLFNNLATPSVILGEFEIPVRGDVVC